MLLNAFFQTQNVSISMPTPNSILAGTAPKTTQPRTPIDLIAEFKREKRATLFRQVGK